MSEIYQVICPTCATVNRLPRTRPAEQAACGKCRERLFQGKPIALSAETFDKHIANSQLPVLVDFWAEWCGPCKMMAPEFEKAAASLEPHVQLAKLNTDTAQMVAGNYQIRGIPTLILYQNGREIARQAGAMRHAQIVDWVKAHM